MPPRSTAASRVPRLAGVKWKAPVAEIFVFVSALALEKTLKPSTTLSVILFAIAVIAGTALLASLIWNSEWLWSHVAGKVAPHLPAVGPALATEFAAMVDGFVSAVDDLLDELSTIDTRLTEAIKGEFYAFNFFLPATAYHRHKNAISARSADAREALSNVYVQADALNERVRRCGQDGVEMNVIPEPDPLMLKESVSRDSATLRQLRP
jgi:hypothetical protein